jgi:hypothetical protein
MTDAKDVPTTSNGAIRCLFLYLLDLSPVFEHGIFQ